MSTQAQSSSGGPIRLARISYVDGSVSFRPTSDIDWTGASINQPIQQGAQLWANDGGRAEVQFDDGSVLRLGNGAVVTLQTMNSDSNGEYTDIQVNDGTVTMISKNSSSVYQIDGPYASLRTDGASRVRVDASGQQRIVDLGGTVQIQDQAQQSTMQSGDAVSVGNANDPLNIYNAPSQDSWDRFNRDRDDYSFSSHRDPSLPYNVSLVAGNLSQYGGWRVVAGYGNVWYPHESEGWRPYWRGHWVWIEPFGWTWVGNEAWGWAPYHYGSWIHNSYGWGWCPGPVTQYWTPAAVSFSNYNNQICWAPLCPQEIRYPSAISVGFTSGNWAFNFSIGGVACYVPTQYGYCEPHRFNYYGYNRPQYNTRITNVYNNYTVNNFYGNVGQNVNFVPRNARYGAVLASHSGFAGGGHFEALGNRGMQAFAHGASVRGEGGTFGASLAVPNRTSLSPSRSFLSRSSQPNQLGRRVFTPNQNRFGQGFPANRTATSSRNQGSSWNNGGRANNWQSGNRPQPRGNSGSTSLNSGSRWNAPQKSSGNTNGNRNTWKWNPPQRTNQSNSHTNTSWGSSGRTNNSHWNPPQRTNQSNSHSNSSWGSSGRTNNSHWNPPQRTNQSNSHSNSSWGSSGRTNNSHWNPPQRTNQSNSHSNSSWGSAGRTNNSHWNPPQRTNQSNSHSNSSWGSSGRTNNSHWNPPQRTNQSNSHSNSSWGSSGRTNNSHWNPPQRTNQSNSHSNSSWGSSGRTNNRSNQRSNQGSSQSNQSKKNDQRGHRGN